ncbi:hypothetical protein SAMN04488238_1396 [Roseicitreum antarcticum]|uniref:Uncharacterized protein n=1 Tax=Roseicitreum antarcticum TaxID=564137 RepID=A0A1H3FHB2_9RHOB|nr:hypothetical protein SAMN04488238_1396 [Roseicitreum antarcticum]
MVCSTTFVQTMKAAEPADIKHCDHEILAIAAPSQGGSAMSLAANPLLRVKTLLESNVMRIFAFRPRRIIHDLSQAFDSKSSRRTA